MKSNNYSNILYIFRRTFNALFANGTRDPPRRMLDTMQKRSQSATLTFEPRNRAHKKGLATNRATSRVSPYSSLCYRFAVRVFLVP
jgi:hypothetical protein